MTRESRCRRCGGPRSRPSFDPRCAARHPDADWVDHAAREIELLVADTVGTPFDALDREAREELSLAITVIIQAHFGARETDEG